MSGKYCKAKAKVERGAENEFESIKAKRPPGRPITHLLALVTSLTESLLGVNQSSGGTSTCQCTLFF